MAIVTFCLIEPIVDALAHLRLMTRVYAFSQA